MSVTPTAGRIVLLAFLVLTTLQQLCTAQTTLSQREALMRIYNSTGGQQGKWIHKYLWNISVANCSAYGVVCIGGMVTELKLAQNGLTGTLPDVFDSFPMLSRLDVSSNRITGTLPPTLFGPALTHVFITNNFISGYIPSTIENSYILTGLFLGYNKLKGHIPQGLCNSNPTLANLQAEENQFTSFPSCLGNSQSLRTLIMNNNDLGGRVDPALCNASSLTVLLLSANPRLYGPIPECLSNLAGINSFSLLATKYTGPFPFWIGNWTNLISFGIQGFRGTIPDIWDSFPLLNDVTLNGDPTGEQPYGKLPPTLFSSPVASITIAYTKIEDVLPNMTNLTNLFQFQLINCPKITGVFPVEILTVLWNQLPPNWNNTLDPSPNRSIQLWNTGISGQLPDLTPWEYPLWLSLLPGAFTFQGSPWTGYIPSSLALWMPRASWKFLLKGCNRLFGPIHKPFLDMTDGFTGFFFALQPYVIPGVVSMAGGNEIELGGSNLFNVSFGQLSCGFCYGYNSTVRDAYCHDVDKVQLRTPITFVSDQRRGYFRCVTPPFPTNDQVYVVVLYTGKTENTTRTALVSFRTLASFRCYDPHPQVTSLTPLLGRPEGCTSMTITGKGFANAPNFQIVFGNTSNYPPGNLTIVGQNINIQNDTYATFVLPSSSSTIQAEEYPYPLNTPLPFTVYPDGYSTEEGSPSQNLYTFRRTCRSPLVPCANGQTDPEGCPNPLCRCHSTGECELQVDLSYKCHCFEGYQGSSCDACKENLHGPQCLACTCDPGHGSCAPGITGSPTCDCDSSYFGTTCATSKVLVGVLVPASVLTFALVVFIAAKCCKKRKGDSGEYGESLNVVRNSKSRYG
jgi:Leucine-rich repeat (LRR) protein